MAIRFNVVRENGWRNHTACAMCPFAGSNRSTINILDKNNINLKGKLSFCMYYAFALINSVKNTGTLNAHSLTTWHILYGNKMNKRREKIKGNILWAATSTFHERKKDVLNVKKMCQVVNYIGGNKDDFVKITRILKKKKSVLHPHTVRLSIYTTSICLAHCSRQECRRLLQFSWGLWV